MLFDEAPKSDRADLYDFQEEQDDLLRHAIENRITSTVR